MSNSEQPVLSGESIDEGRGRIFPCPECGADLIFHTGQQALVCPFCGAEQKIELDPQSEVLEQDFQDMLQKLHQRKPENSEPSEQNEVRCESCGANVVFQGTLTSTSCPYCGSPIQRERVHRGGNQVPVDAVLPFEIAENQARHQLTKWIRSRWFAPNDFKSAGQDDKFHGVYLPFWTFDTLTFTRYSGERGEHYTVTTGSGKNRQTHRRTRWRPASGKFQKFFDDVLIQATQGMPRKHIDNLSPWPLVRAVPFRAEYLAGFFSRTYDIDLAPGFEIARSHMENHLHSMCRSDIGGDDQRIHKMDCRYDAVTYKHLLLPVWILAFRFRNRSFRVFVNAMTGEVQGDRPYSFVKIFFAIAAVVLIATMIALVAMH